MLVPTSAFDREFLVFKELIRDRFDGRDFVSFQEGLTSEWEDYKEALRVEALRRLDMSKWTTSDVGSGKIIKNAISAIEIKEPGSGLRNNLVEWTGKYGPAGRSHIQLLNASMSGPKLLEFEQWFLDFSSGESSDEELFEKFRALAGSRYDLLAYLFFLKDWTRFMPIAPSYFDKLFQLLEVPLVTSHKCSWENYSEYNHTLRSVQRHLIERAGFKDARLVDAHSFCWLRIKLPDSGRR